MWAQTWVMYSQCIPRKNKYYLVSWWESCKNQDILPSPYLIFKSTHPPGSSANFLLPFLIFLLLHLSLSFPFALTKNRRKSPFPFTWALSGSRKEFYDKFHNYKNNVAVESIPRVWGEGMKRAMLEGKTYSGWKDKRPGLFDSLGIQDTWKDCTKRQQEHTAIPQTKAVGS